MSLCEFRGLLPCREINVVVAGIMNVFKALLLLLLVAIFSVWHQIEHILYILLTNHFLE